MSRKKREPGELSFIVITITPISFFTITSTSVPEFRRVFSGRRCVVFQPGVRSFSNLPLKLPSGSVKAQTLLHFVHL